MRTVQADFEPRADSVQAARRFVQEALVRWGCDSVEWAASQVISELATNAVLHARTPFVVELALDERQLTVRVRDESRRSPVVRHFGDEATTGRGLALVDQLSQTWGVDRNGAGKTVWSTLDLNAHEEQVDEMLADIELDALLDQFDDLSDGGPGHPSTTACAA